MKGETESLQLEASALCCIRDDRTLFEDLTFRLQPGQVLVLEGRNGSGKTSLLKLLCGIRLPDGGSLSWGGRDIFRMGPEYHACISYVGHKDGVKLDLTAVENLKMARGLGEPDESRTCRRATCRPASSAAWHWRGCWLPGRDCGFWTNLSPRWIPTASLLSKHCSPTMCPMVVCLR
jgi:ABC-type uncharacterized transport system ATPase component